MSEVTIPAGFGLEDDPDVYDAVKKLAIHSVEVAIELLDTAAPQQQLQMVRILIPRLMGSLTRGGEDEQEELRATVNKMYQEVIDALGGDDGDS